MADTISSTQRYMQRMQEIAVERTTARQPIPKHSHELKPIQQAALTGVLPGFWGSDHIRELENNKGWTFDAVHKIAKLYASATPCVSVAPQGVVGKGYGTAQDAPDEQWQPDRNHPAYRLLMNPNEFIDGVRFRYQIGQQKCLTGGALVWEPPNKLGKPYRRWVIPRAWAQPQSPTNEYPLGYFKITPYRSYWTQFYAWPFGPGSFAIDTRETMLIGWPDAVSPGECTSALDACSRLIDTANMTETAVWASMLNGIKPSIAFSIDPKSGVQPTEEQWEQFEAKLTELKSGPHNAGKILGMIGLGVQLLNLSPSELESVQNRDQNRKFVQTIHGASPTISGETEQTAYSAAAVAINTTIELGVQSDCDMIAAMETHRWQRYWGKPAGGQEFRVTYDVKRVDDPTLDLQWASVVASAYKDQVVTGNEYRAKLKLSPRPELDELKKPDPVPGMPGMGGASGAPGAPGAQPQEEDPLAAFDLGDEPSDDEGTGIKQPALQAASGNRLPAFSTNGAH